MVDLCGQISGVLKLCDILLYNGGSHPSALGAGSGHDGKAESNVVKPWVLELEVGKAEERIGTKEGPWFLYKGSGCWTPPPKPKNLPIPK